MKRVRFYLLCLGLCLAMVGLATGVVLARPEQDAAAPSQATTDTREASADTAETLLIPADASKLDLSSGTSLAPGSRMGQDLLRESEPNNTSADADPLGNNVVVLGHVFPNADVDFYSFTAGAGDRVYAAVMTSGSSNGSTDSVMDLLDVDGTTILETDDNDGSMGASSSTIAGATIPAGGTYYIRVRHFSAASQLRPYHLHLQVQSGSPTAESEPNDAGQPLPAGGWVSGALSATTDVDIYTIDLNAGDTVFLSLDLDPERDTVEWNGWVGLGVFGGFYLVVNDAGAATPDSEAFFLTVKDTGTYAVLVSVPTGGTTFGSYHLSVSVHPAEAQTCTTYTSTDTPLPIADQPGGVTSSITVPGNPRIADLNLSLDITHNLMADLDVNLVSPAGNDNGLFNDIGSTTAGSFTAMNMGLDDEAGSPPVFQVTSGMVYQPELNYRLSWFDGENAGGTWNLVIRDDKTVDTGTLNSWSLTICEPPPLPTCPGGTTQVTIYSSDFEANDGGFTHSGTQDEWERGTPTFAPITTCNSGTNCWKTDLDNTYNASSNQNLLSPALSLVGYTGPVILSWAQRYNIESASFDHAFVDVQQVGGATPRRLFEWYDATMSVTVGNPSATIQESSGWSVFNADISSYLGQNVEVLFHLDSDTTVQFTGLAIDDVFVTACVAAGTPLIDLNKTVGTDLNTCASTSSLDVPANTDVTYCYEVTNTGTVTLTLHTVDDSELGNIVTGLNYTLGPGDSTYITETATITQTVTNVGTWTAYTPGPTNVVSDTASATVTVIPPGISLNKTVGTDANSCATTDSITVGVGTTVYYCYEVTNTGLTTLGFHDLDDDQLGTILSGFAYALDPAASVFITESAVITQAVTNSATWTAYNPGPTDVVTATDTANVSVVLPEPLTCNATPVAFELGIPADWTVVDNTGGTGIVWTTTADTANCGIANQTNGSGEAACADSDNAGSGAPPFDTELVSNAFDLTGFNVVTLDTAAYYRDLNTGTNDVFQVDVWNGTSWNNELTWNEDHEPEDISLDLSSYGGLSGVQIRFRYAGDGFDWFAEVDDVALSCDLVVEPDIAVDPTSMSSTQSPDTVITQTLTISNLGNVDLTWDIFEGSAAAPLGGWSDNFDSYATDSQMHGQGGWKGWFNDPAAGAFTRDEQSISTPNSVEILGASDLVHEYTGYNTGVWVYTAWQYVPTDFTGESYFLLLNTYNDAGSGLNWSTQVRFVSATNEVIADGLGGPVATLPLIKGQWMQLRVVIDLIADSQTFYYGNDVLFQGSWTNGVSGNGALNIGAVDLFAANASAVYYDDLSLTEIAPCDTPGDTPWLSESPTSGTTGSGSSDAVTVSFDSTGLSTGVYTGTLCVGSNDPDTPLISVPVQMEVVLPPPDIEVSPAAFSVEVPVTTTLTQTLTISNLGGSDLAWTIAEGERPTVAAPSVIAHALFGGPTAPGTAAETVGNAVEGVAAPVTYGPTATYRPQGDVLYDNGPLVNSPGTGSGGADESMLQTNLTMNILGFGHQTTANNSVADDFVIPTGEQWTIDTITFYAYQTGSTTTSTITGMNVDIYDGDPSSGGTVIASSTTMLSSQWANIYRVTDTTSGNTQRPIMATVMDLGSLVLTEGTYWIEWQASGSLASGPWAPPITINGQTATGNGLQNLAGVWGAALDVGQQGLPFTIAGTADAGCSTDLPWVTTSPDNGTTSAGESSDVVVTFDSTGYVPGVYTGTLCINSNDPTTPLVSVPLTMTVVGQEFGVVLSADDAASAAPGETVTYTVSITNTGNVADTFDLSLSGAGWSSTLSDSSVTLAAGGSTTVEVVVTVPLTATDGLTDTVTLTAVSQSDASATDSADFTTTAVVVIESYTIFMPVVAKP